MRPTILNPLFAPATTLKGVGPRLDKALARLFGTNGEPAQVRDLLFHMPSGLVDRRNQPKIASLPPEGIATVSARVERHLPSPRGSRAPYRVIVADETGELTLAFFSPRSDWINDKLPVGEDVVVSGRIEWFKDSPQMVHPDHIVRAGAAEQMPMVEPVYPLTAGLSGRVLRNALAQALERVPDLPEWQDHALLTREGWTTLSEALRRLHAPESTKDLGERAAPRRRLAYDEMLASQLALALVRASMKRGAGRARTFDGRLARRITDALPFSLTPAQRQAIEDIEGDLRAPARMLRLLQGDVGAGKTAVALVAMAHAVEAGAQAAMMAPTELLARQHLATIQPLAESAGLDCRILTGREKGARRAETLHRIATGETDIVVGTHALFQEGVEFAELGLAVVDEQHRFGVHQRLALGRKSMGADVLVMTATPIPRTLVLTYFGDMDVSKLKGKPAGRQPIDTRAVSLERLGEVVERVCGLVDGGARVYWVCPLVEESELLDVAAAEERYGALTKALGDRVGLVHGRMKSDEKAHVMARFRSGEVGVLVATTVIEVGVDVPDATVMVIEHAERFGLSQLHQLRGRVGRGSERSRCLLLYKPPLGEAARARLNTMRSTEDGFVIAEEDLKLRGEGDVLGTRQSGSARFRIARPEVDADLLEVARDDARLVLARDPELKGERAQALRLLLYLFGRDDAVRLMRAG